MVPEALVPFTLTQKLSRRAEARSSRIFPGAGAIWAAARSSFLSQKSRTKIMNYFFVVVIWFVFGKWPRNDWKTLMKLIFRFFSFSDNVLFLT